MGLRIQKERMSGGVSAADYVDRYQINLERLARTKPGAVYLHPGPINEGVEVTRGVARGPTSLVLEQARNGVPVRMAVLALLAEGSSAREPATRVVQDEAPVAAAPTPVARRQLPAARDVSSAKR
jgi:aspartate carbamoyltransferase catalytic subunit